MVETSLKRTSMHWGAYDVQVTDGRISGVHPWTGDSDPSAIGKSIPSAVHHDSRVRQPMVRSGWLEHGPQPGRGGRGREPFVEVSWDRALDLVSAELKRIKKSYGNEAIFGGSYGWSSAGRFHHATSQVHRFLNQIGGYVSSVGSYSAAAAHVIVPRIVGTVFSSSSGLRPPGR